MRRYAHYITLAEYNRLTKIIDKFYHNAPSYETIDRADDYKLGRNSKFARLFNRKTYQEFQDTLEGFKLWCWASDIAGQAACYRHLELFNKFYGYYLRNLKSRDKIYPIHVVTLLSTLEEVYHDLEGVAKQAGPSKTSVYGLTLSNPQRFSNQAIKHVAQAIQVIGHIFKQRGILLAPKDFLDTVRIYAETESDVLGRAYMDKAYIEINLVVLKTKGLRILLSDPLLEALVHELGHMLDGQLSPKAKQFWREPWKAIKNKIQAEKDDLIKNYVVTQDDRRRYWLMLIRTKFDLQKALQQIKGLDREKFGTWLRSYGAGPLITPKRFRLTPLGKQRFQAAAYALGVDNDFMEGYNNRMSRAQHLLDVLHDSLYVDDSMKISPSHTNVEKQLQAIEQRYKKELQSLGLPTDYAYTNETEDFAETFATYVLNPSKLSPTALFRLKRTLWLDGYYSGKMKAKLAYKPRDLV